jgi:hypothetical protein
MSYEHEKQNFSAIAVLTAVFLSDFALLLLLDTSFI